MASTGTTSTGSGVNSYAIVAIPKKDDYVWNISSEKIPHLTMLYLGNQLNNVDSVKEFVQHVVDASLCEFYLDVDRRGVLGDNLADVLFLHGYDLKILKNIRSFLLQDPNIAKSYWSVKQYPEWTPHLTLGYPDAPAKPDMREYPGTHVIKFDRLALWTGNYEGVEFPLKSNSDGASLEMMSSRGETFLEHYGVKGMKWGVIRSRTGSVGKAAGSLVKEAYKPSKDYREVKKFQTKAKLGGVRTLDNREMQKVIQRMVLEKQYRELYGEHQLHDEAVSRAKRYAKRGAKWAGNLVNDILRDAGSSWLKRPGSGRSDSAWANGQNFANAIEGSFVERRAIGS